MIKVHFFQWGLRSWNWVAGLCGGRFLFGYQREKLCLSFINLDLLAIYFWRTFTKHNFRVWEKYSSNLCEYYEICKIGWILCHLSQRQSLLCDAVAPKPFASRKTQSPSKSWILFICLFGQQFQFATTLHCAVQNVPPLRKYVVRFKRKLRLNQFFGKVKSWSSQWSHHQAHPGEHFPMPECLELAW